MSLILFELKIQFKVDRLQIALLLRGEPPGGGAPYFSQRYCKGRVIVGMFSEASVS